MNHFNRCAVALRNGRGATFSVSVDDEHGAFIKVTPIECACSMREMVCAILDTERMTTIQPKLLSNRVHGNLVEMPIEQDIGHTREEFEMVPPGRRVSMQGLSVNPRVPKKSHVIDVFESDASFGKAPIDCMSGETCMVLDPGESFFLAGGNDLAVTHQRGSSVV